MSNEAIKTLATWGRLGRLQLRWWRTMSGTWRRNPMYRLKMLLPHRKRYGPTVTFYRWWRLELAVEPRAKSMAAKLERSFGVAPGTLQEDSDAE